MRKPKPTLLLHGPITNYSAKVVEDVKAALRYKLIRGVVVSTYQDNLEVLKAITIFDNVVVVENEDVENPGFFNLNRQLNLVNAGLNVIESDQLVIKLRLDQRINFPLSLRQIRKWASKTGHRGILTTNTFTRTDRLFHPSDMLLVGLQSELRAYYSIAPRVATHVDTELALATDIENLEITEAQLVAAWPESALFYGYLLAKGERPPFTLAASLDALSRHVTVIPAIRFNLRWEKFYGGRLPLIPYKFQMRPFPGGPLEDCECTYASGNSFLIKVMAFSRFVVWHPYLDLIRNPHPGSYRLFAKLVRVWLRGFLASPAETTRQIWRTLRGL